MGGVTKKPRRDDADFVRRYSDVLSEAIDIVEGEGIGYVVGGSLASIHWGRPGSHGDIDVMIAPPDAKRLLKAFDAAGYDTEVTFDQWLYKARKNDITVDLIFEMENAMYVDEQMIEHGSIEDVHGVRLRLMGPEDFVVSQALSTAEDTPDYWYNALSVLARPDLDWDYLVERAANGPRRVLSLLVFAQSDDRAVPEIAIRGLFDTIYES
jgi:predicted nucleotidyltransferase